jgi:hypothetical protein
MLSHRASSRARDIVNLHVPAWIDTSAVFVALSWIMLWEWMNPLGSPPATDFGERAWALRHEGHGSRATLPKPLRGRRGCS